MKWIKQGLIFNPSGEYDWMQSHVSPMAAVELDDRIRVFITTRSKLDTNGNYTSYTTYIDLNTDNPKEIIYLHDKPIIDLGNLGSFDENGIMVAKPIMHDDKLFLYYMGWQRMENRNAPYQVAVGLATSVDHGKTFKKVSEGPIIGIDHYDPISIGNVFVLYENDLWHMYYTSFTSWAVDGQKPTPVYCIKYAYSEDGIFWSKTNEIIVDKNLKGGVATPTIFKKDGVYHMLFGYRPAYNTNNSVAGYSIGYASSKNLSDWRRDDSKAGISTSKDGWDSEMICYPHVIKVKNEYLMFYCGNNFGRDGFGFAILEDKV